MSRTAKHTIIRSLVLTCLLVAALAASAVAGQKFSSKSTGGMGAGDAVIELTPELKDKNTLVVRFAANTHNVELSSYDFMQAATLEYDGKKLKPSRSDRLRGHHSFGKLVFTIDAKPDKFKIVIRGIPGVKQRIYEW